jgi:hypothetical protein
MQPQHDESAFDWIRQGRDALAVSRSPEWAGNFVSHLMPTMFEAYAKVFHHIEASYENIDKALSQAEITILKIPPCEELRSFVESQRASAKGRRIRWKELAELLNVPFAPSISHEWYLKKLERGCWAQFLRGPDEGLLRPEECSQLVSVLKPFTNNAECFFRFNQIPFINTGKPLLFHGALDELGGFLTAGAYQFSPEYWWPPRQSWCVCSDYDLMFTFVGGSRKLISALLTSDVLECMEITSQTRIDSFALMP